MLIETSPGTLGDPSTHACCKDPAHRDNWNATISQFRIFLAKTVYPVLDSALATTQGTNASASSRSGPDTTVSPNARPYPGKTLPTTTAAEWSEENVCLFLNLAS